MAALESITSKCRIPVSVQAPVERYSSQVEAAAYFVVAEGLANVTKHAQASHAQISVEESGGQLVILVEDDGLGTADPDNGSGLLGLVDRTEALGGHLQISSRPGEGTTLRAWLPLPTD